LTSNPADVFVCLVDVLTVLISISSGIDNHSASIQVRGRPQLTIYYTYLCSVPLMFMVQAFLILELRMFIFLLISVVLAVTSGVAVTFLCR